MIRTVSFGNPPTASSVSGWAGRMALISAFLLSAMLAVASADAAGPADRAYISEVVGADSRVNVLDTKTNTVIHQIDAPEKNGPISAAMVSSDASRVYFTDITAKIHVLDTTATPPKFLTSLPADPNAWGISGAMMLSRDDETLFKTTPSQGLIVVYDTTNGSIRHTINLPAVGAATAFPLAMDMSLDGSRLYVASASGGIIYVVDTALYTVTNWTVPTTSFPPPNLSNILVVNTVNGERIYVADSEDRIHILDNTGTVQATLKSPKDWMPYGLVASRDHSKVYVSGRSVTTQGVILEIDTATHAMPNPGLFETCSNMTCASSSLLGMSEDGQYLYVSSPGFGEFHIFDTTTGKNVKTMNIENANGIGAGRFTSYNGTKSAGTTYAVTVTSTITDQYVSATPPSGMTGTFSMSLNCGAGQVFPITTLAAGSVTHNVSAGSSCTLTVSGKPGLLNGYTWSAGTITPAGPTTVSGNTTIVVEHEVIPPTPPGSYTVTPSSVFTPAPASNNPGVPPTIGLSCSSAHTGPANGPWTVQGGATCTATTSGGTAPWGYAITPGTTTITPSGSFTVSGNMTVTATTTVTRNGDVTVPLALGTGNTFYDSSANAVVPGGTHHTPKINCIPQESGTGPWTVPEGSQCTILVDTPATAPTGYSLLDIDYSVDGSPVSSKIFFPRTLAPGVNNQITWRHNVSLLGAGSGVPIPALDAKALLLLIGLMGSLMFWQYRRRNG